MGHPYLKQIIKKETNQTLVSLRMFSEENKVPIITETGLNFLIQLIKLRNISSVLEIGTAIGYSSIAMSLKTKLTITTIERDQKMYDIAKKKCT